MGSLDRGKPAIEPISDLDQAFNLLDQALNMIDVLREALYDTFVQLREAKMLLADINRVAKRDE